MEFWKWETNLFFKVLLIKHNECTYVGARTNISVVGVDLTKVRSLIKPWITYCNQICSDFFGFNENSWKLTLFQDQCSSLDEFCGNDSKTFAYNWHNLIQFRHSKLIGFFSSKIATKSDMEVNWTYWTVQIKFSNSWWDKAADCAHSLSRVFWFLTRSELPGQKIKTFE